MLLSSSPFSPVTGNLTTCGNSLAYTPFEKRGRDGEASLHPPTARIPGQIYEYSRRTGEFHRSYETPIGKKTTGMRTSTWSPANAATDTAEPKTKLGQQLDGRSNSTDASGNPGKKHSAVRA